nr:MAG TPA: hypothetical protein [Caudoviricetes sp.]
MNLNNKNKIFPRVIASVRILFLLKKCTLNLQVTVRAIG